MPRKRPKKKPWMKFWTSDWTAETRKLSRAARSDWLDMCILMWDGDHRGYLSRDGKPLSHAALAQHCGCSVDDISRTFSELFCTGIASEKDGIVYSRRMVREEKISRIRSKSGKKGISKKRENLLKQNSSKSVASSVYPLGIKSSLIVGSGEQLPDGFAEFVNQYPSIGDFDAALAAWIALSPDAELQAEISAAITHNVQSRRWQEGYIPNAANWLRGRQWLTKLPPAKATDRKSRMDEISESFIAGGNS